MPALCTSCHTHGMRPHCGDDAPTCTWYRCTSCGHTLELGTGRTHERATIDQLPDDPAE